MVFITKKYLYFAALIEKEVKSAVEAFKAKDPSLQKIQIEEVRKEPVVPEPPEDTGPKSKADPTKDAKKKAEEVVVAAAVDPLKAQKTVKDEAVVSLVEKDNPPLNKLPVPDHNDVSNVPKKDSEVKVVSKKEKKNESLHPDAIKKEEKEQNAEDPKENDKNEGQEGLLQKLKEQQDEILQGQKQILKELEEHKEKEDSQQPQIPLNDQEQAPVQGELAAQIQPVQGQIQPGLGQPQLPLQVQPGVGQAQLPLQAQLGLAQVQSGLAQVQPVVGQAQPIVGQAQPIMGQPQPLVGQVQPVVGQSQPVVGQPQPVVGQVQPVVGQIQPVVGQVQPGVGQIQPVVGQVQPVMGQVQPVVGQAPIQPNANLGLVNPQQPIKYQSKTTSMNQEQLKEQLKQQVEQGQALLEQQKAILSNLVSENDLDNKKPILSDVEQLMAKVQSNDALAKQESKDGSIKNSLNNINVLSNDVIESRLTDNVKKNDEVLKKKGEVDNAPLISNDIKKESEKLSNTKIVHRKKKVASSLKKEKPLIDEAQNDVKINKIKQHDEERRKRDVDVLVPKQVGIPEIDGNIVKKQVEDNLVLEKKQKDIGEVAYDTRHLLWISRRRKRRNQNRNEDYWDET